MQELLSLLQSLLNQQTASYPQVGYQPQPYKTNQTTVLACYNLQAATQGLDLPFQHG